MSVSKPSPDMDPANTPTRALIDTADVDHALRRKRKVREFKACYPCRQRKVKCNQGTPCKTCTDRQHPELCIYQSATSLHAAKRIDAGDRPPYLTEAPGVSMPHGPRAAAGDGEAWEGLCAALRTVTSELAELKSAVAQGEGRNTTCSCCHHCCSHQGCRPAASKPASEESLLPAEGIHTTTGIGGQTVYLGSSSLPALAVSLDKDNDTMAMTQELVGKDVLPLFGLDNESATYPFVDLWGLPHGSLGRTLELSKALPNDADCWTFLNFYKKTSYVLFPVLGDVETLESQLLQFLLARRGFQADGEGAGVSEHAIFGMDLHWIGLLFAILASGCQCSSMSRADREVASKVNLCCSFDCLRMTNFLSYPAVSTIETLLILGNVLSNNVNAGAAWSLLGLTIRLAQAQGLHREGAQSPRESRPGVWRFVVWQDSLLSLTFDRAASTSADEALGVLESRPGRRTYVECMSRLCQVGLAVIHERARRGRGLQDTLSRTAQLRRQIQDIMRDAAEFLRDPAKGRSQRQKLEHWGLYLQASYITAELCRPGLSPALAGCALVQPLRQACLDSLTDTVEAFVGFHATTAFAGRAWIAVYRCLNCALLLGLFRVPQRDQRARRLLDRVVAIFVDAPDPPELASPVRRSLDVLRRLLDQQQAADGHVASMQDWMRPGASGAGSQGSRTASRAHDIATAEAAESPYALVDSIIWGDTRSDMRAA